MKAEYSMTVPTFDKKVFLRTVLSASDRLLEAVARRGAEIVDEEFSAQGTWEGKWAPLHPLTIERKGHDLILFDSGELATSPFYRKEANKVWVFGVASDKVNPAIIEFGSPSRNLPARPMIGPAFRQLMTELPKLKQQHGTVMDKARDFFGKKTIA